jgi:hypothetical protein
MSLIGEVSKTIQRLSVCRSDDYTGSTSVDYIEYEL